jgi:hypothetical protein
MSHITIYHHPGPRSKGLISLNSKNDKSQKRNDAFLIWSDASPQLSIGQAPVGVQG